MIIHKLLSTALLVQLAACTSEDLALDDGDTPPDLPCGGADLQTDDLNCGACGNACDMVWPGTKYASDGCVDGQCGKTWTHLSDHWPSPNVETCDQLCGIGYSTCVPRGCSGLTAFVCATLGSYGDQCNLAQHEAITDFAGECDEPIPYPENLDAETTSVQYACCCSHLSP